MGPVAEAEHINIEPGVYQPFDGQTDCEVCSKILLLCASQADWTHKQPTLGIAEDVLRNQCSHVALFKDWLHDRITHTPRCARSHLTIDNRTGEHGFIRFQLQARPGIEHSYYVSDLIGLLRKLTVPDHPGAMRVVDPQWIDVGLLEQWVTACDTTHGDQCRQSSWLRHLKAFRPKYLVDTLDMCVVKGNRIEAEYIALSYQWGQAKMLRNTTGLRERLLKPSSLSEGDLACDIPRTISDAFGVVILLGYRYLWVDALCVVSTCICRLLRNEQYLISDQTQDDPAEIASELPRMHRIYHCADFTIIAADGSDANHGLRGLKGLTASRNNFQVPTQLSGSEWVATRHPSKAYFKSRGVPNTYYTRAWTFQECGFSLRKLIFANDTIEWCCEHGQMHEAVIRELPGSSYRRQCEELYRPTVHRLLAARMPTPASLGDLVSAYNTRNLTFPEDALSAFAGTQSLLEQFYQSGFLYGLPEFWFELALYWTPRGNIKRRIASSSRSSTGTSYQLPSWSWIGWTGKITFPNDDTRPPDARFTEPITKWYAISHPASLDRRPITPVWHEYRSRAMEGRLTTLPQGWEQSHAERGVLFSHTRHPFRRYSYPFPVPEPCSTSASTSVSQTAYLSAKTNRAFLFGKGVQINPLSMLEKHPLWLVSSEGQCVGLLYLNNAEERSYFNRADSGLSSTNALELVAISRGTSTNLLSPELDRDVTQKFRSTSNFHHFDSFDTFGNGLPIDCMFVLWIEWEDGVAYRRACGVVNAEAWEREREKELVDLILG